MVTFMTGVVILLSNYEESTTVVLRVALSLSAIFLVVLPFWTGRRRTMIWALGFTGVTLIGLAVLSVGLFVMLALTDASMKIFATVAGGMRVFAPEAEIASIESGTFGWAFALASGVAWVTAAGVARLIGHTTARRWPPVLQGLAAAAVATLLSLVVLLLRLGIDPVGFLTNGN
ncbi:hypothetical protein [Cryobacterium mannosilyticum]|uniref:Uncharacterized protein n=1 Tax=Cryobacterium mannosilyticum TaxID=1259190 RepID=A0A4R8WB19_9MICO|nr:hypothetical protein [Cryobacterium mannosilyticum]TFC05290.1 hypothetical protein E3O32_06315 [Cryobacterium mannosilyticum]